MPCRTAESLSDHRAVGGGLAGGRGRDPAVGREGRACRPAGKRRLVAAVHAVSGGFAFPSCGCGAELILGLGPDLRQTCYGSLST
jgi:hypothetical protein